MNGDILPPEILFQMMRNLSLRDLQNAARVCRAWHATATTILQSWIRLLPSPSDQIISIVDLKNTHFIIYASYHKKIAQLHLINKLNGCIVAFAEHNKFILGMVDLSNGKFASNDNNSITVWQISPPHIIVVKTIEFTAATAKSQGHDELLTSSGELCCFTAIKGVTGINQDCFAFYVSVSKAPNKRRDDIILIYNLRNDTLQELKCGPPDDYTGEVNIYFLYCFDNRYVFVYGLHLWQMWEVATQSAVNMRCFKHLYKNSNTLIFVLGNRVVAFLDELSFIRYDFLAQKELQSYRLIPHFIDYHHPCIDNFFPLNDEMFFICVTERYHKNFRRAIIFNAKTNSVIPLPENLAGIDAVFRINNHIVAYYSEKLACVEMFDIYSNSVCNRIAVPNETLSETIILTNVGFVAVTNSNKLVCLGHPLT